MRSNLSKLLKKIKVQGCNSYSRVALEINFDTGQQRQNKGGHEEHMRDFYAVVER
jgi:hypothetical protein